MELIVQLLLSAVSVYFTAWLLPGIHISSFGTAVGVAIVLALLNIFLKPVLVFFSLPITILTFGFFLWIINTVLIMVCSSLIGGFHVDNFLWGMLFSAILSFISSLLISTDV